MSLKLQTTSIEISTSPKLHVSTSYTFILRIKFCAVKTKSSCITNKVQIFLKHPRGKGCSQEMAAMVMQQKVLMKNLDEYVASSLLCRQHK